MCRRPPRYATSAAAGDPGRPAGPAPLAPLGDHRRHRRGRERSGDDRERQAGRRVPDVDEDQLRRDPAEDRRQAEAEMAEAVHQALEQEEQAHHAEQAERVRREDDERVTRDREDRGDRVDREHHVEGGDHHEGGRRGGRGRRDAPQHAHRERLLRVDLLAAVARDLHGGEREQDAEHVRRDVERVERRGADEDEQAAKHDRPADAVQQHAPALLGRHREEREQHREDEEVVERQRLLDEEAGEILLRRRAAVEDQQDAGEPGADDGPDHGPSERAPYRRRPRGAGDDVDGQGDEDERAEREPRDEHCDLLRGRESVSKVWPARMLRAGAPGRVRPG